MKMVRGRGFTVIELLAVVGLVGLLGFILLPVWRSNAADVRTARCAENLRKLGYAVALYAEENAGKFPGCQHEMPSWVDSLQTYVPAAHFLCAGGDPRRAGRGVRRETFENLNRWSYALNDFLTPNPYGAKHLNFSHIETVPSPGETMLFGEVAQDYQIYDHFHFADAVDNGFSPEAFAEQVAVEQHDTEANYLFVDGRVDLLGWASGARPKLKMVGSKFVHPAGDTGERHFARR